MANIVQNVLIDFQVSDESLVASTDRLEELGKVEKANTEEFKKANVEINKQAKALDAISAVSKKIDATGKVTKNTLQDLTTAVKGTSATFQKEFQKGITEELKRAGITAEQFEAALKKGVDSAQAPVKSLRQQLKDMTLQLAEMKLRGDDSSASYRQLAAEAGRLKDTIGDAAQEVSNFASDTSTFDGLIQTAQGLAGGFAVAQGAIALFGDESEELQKTLLKVNAVMAILQGLQSIQNVLQKESAASRLADVVATKAQVAAQTLFAFVVGNSTGALKLFKIALAATGVGLLIIGLVELVSYLTKTEEGLANVTEQIERQKNMIEVLNGVISDNSEIAIAEAEAAGAAESKLTALRGNALLRQRQNVIETQKEQIALRDTLHSSTQAWAELNNAIEANNKVLRGIDQDLALAAIKFGEQTAAEAQAKIDKAAADAKKAADDAKRFREEQLQKEKEARAAGFADYKAGIEVRLLAAKKGTEEELQLQKDLLKAELQGALDNEKLTLNQRRLLIQKFFKERLALGKEFSELQNEQNLKHALDNIAADLSMLEMGEEQRLQLRIDTLKVQSYLEIQAAEGNASKIAAIEGARDRAIREARIASIQETVNYEISLFEAQNGATRRRQQAIAQDTREEVDLRLEAIDEIAAADSASIQARISALNEEREQQLISQKDYNLQYAQLEDQQVQIFETAEEAKTRIALEESEKRKQRTLKDIGEALNVAAQSVGVLTSIYESQNQKEDDLLKGREQRIKDLREAGAITEKEAISRQKRLEADERQVRQRQAQREKTIALFNAGLAIPRAVLQGLATGGPILAAIYGAIAAAEFAIIAARPVPKFAKGKKDKYEGPGIVGEAGTELVESGGRMYVADKATKIWLNKDDKVYNARETASMMQGVKMNSEVPLPVAAKKQDKIDYDKFGKAVARHIETNVFIDGVPAAHLQQQAFTNYLNSRRSAR